MQFGHKRLHRRTVLAGAGATIALPLLDAMIPPSALSRGVPKRPIRFVAFEMVHGSAGSTTYGRERNLWSPAAAGATYEITPILKPLAPFRNELTIISNTTLKGATSEQAYEDGPGVDHARSSACFLTGAHPLRGSRRYVGASIDQMYAKAVGSETPLHSLQLGIEDPNDPGNGQPWPQGYDPAYRQCISWSDAGTPLVPQWRLSTVFARFFGRPSHTGDPSGSVLDSVTDSSGRLRRKLGADDRRRVDAHLTALRDVERRISAIERSPDVSPPFSEQFRVLSDLLILAFAADITRIATVKLSMDRSQRIYSESGVDGPFHVLSHHKEEPERIEKFARLNTFHVQQLAYFLHRLRGATDGESNLLHQSAVLYGSPMGDSHVHAHDYLPLVLAGRAGGRIRGGQHVACPSGTPMANLLLSMAHSLGMAPDRIGDSDGQITI